MKKLLALGMVLTLATSVSFGATSYTGALKNAIKQDIQNAKQETKEAIKKDIEAKQKVQKDAANAKKTQKLKEINAKIAQTNKEIAAIKNDKNMTYTEKAFKTRALEKQLEYLNKQKDALK